MALCCEFFPTRLWSFTEQCISKAKKCEEFRQNIKETSHRAQTGTEPPFFFFFSTFLAVQSIRAFCQVTSFAADLI